MRGSKLFYGFPYGILKNSKKRKVSIIHGMLFFRWLNRPNICTCIGEAEKFQTMLDIEFFRYDPHPQLHSPYSKSRGFLSPRTPTLVTQEFWKLGKSSTIGRRAGHREPAYSCLWLLAVFLRVRNTRFTFQIPWSFASDYLIYLKISLYFLSLILIKFNSTLLWNFWRQVSLGFKSHHCL